jgi:hypothetical protein
LISPAFAALTLGLAFQSFAFERPQLGFHSRVRQATAGSRAEPGWRGPGCDQSAG